MAYFTSPENYWHFFRLIVPGKDAVSLSWKKKGFSTEPNTLKVTASLRNQHAMTPACVLMLEQLPSDIELTYNLPLTLTYKSESNAINHIDLRSANRPNWIYRNRIVIYPMLDHVAWQF